MPKEHILIFLSDVGVGQLTEDTPLRSAGYEVNLVKDFQTYKALVRASLPDVVILGERLPGEDGDQELNGLDVAASLLEKHPNLPIMLVAYQDNDTLLAEAMRIGIVDYLRLPLEGDDILLAVRRALKRGRKIKEWARGEVRRNTQSLEARLGSLETLQNIGRAVTSSLNLDSVLTAVVDAAVDLTGAEKGSLLLLDESTGELYMRASRNFGDDFVRTFRLPASDTLAGEVLRTGKPMILDEKTPKKIKTAYLVHNLMYVPLMVYESAIGVLGVDNRQSGHPFSEYHLGLVSALAGYAAVAIHNASLYARSEVERNELETILTRITDGVIVVDLDGRLMLINQTARHAFAHKADESPTGKPADEAIHSLDLVEILGDPKAKAPFRSEIGLDDGRVFNAQVTPIPEVGLAVILQDITHLKELDRIKSEFVNTVSHDLRSPLTAILGYIELIERVGPVNEQQLEFIRRVELSVQNITALINDLLDLGRIEAGFDARKEIVPLPALVDLTVDSLLPRFEDNAQLLVVDIPQNLPAVLGNPIRLRQMLVNLITNALKYTQAGGEIRVSAQAEGGQVILQVSDDGLGIPLAEQPYIFDKFYRASNVAREVSGTGLGLAIVKSIVDNHQGRIWVKSSPGKGTMFTVVLPAAR
ncbi:MAG: hypothetical protein A2Z16_04175 [Chloroflexi bacterium RBG_16_54_18]|nr:MAG: hypothetical protein A2Z16_04175 [Chloroflexi bacterium RBG_16_54_18]